MPPTTTAYDVDDLGAITDLAAAVGRERFAPRAAQWDADRTPTPLQDRQFRGSPGFLGIALPGSFDKRK
ncbi:hypothetical protein [Gordonia hydrophobica]|uniref:Acyl-CoA dehydrogenase n=1 Tax=Gordonia hydrophobica TaxID=40516 RepID=A0ABZ2TWA6_9ACTN|nr:hypothetical protein [Gordonia hydrophobica]MBM7365822.1 hypothetical protein [Gordonia hydrophobica]